MSYNITQKSIEKLEVDAGVTSDSAFADKVIPLLKQDDLVLRDLGFFNVKHFKAIEEQGAYYISRYFLATNLYIDNQKVELLDFLQAQKENRWIDKEVTISTQQLPTRLIAIPVPDNVYNQRVRDLKEGYRRRGKTPKKETLALQRYVVFITNIPRATLLPEHIGTIYRLRWQIELVFKRWKSIFKIDRLTGKNGNRILCFIYAKLIAILLLSTFEQYAFHSAYLINRELSFDKFFKWILNRDRFARLLAGSYSIAKLLHLIELNIGRLLKDKRKKRLSSLDLILHNIPFYSDCYDTIDS